MRNRCLVRASALSYTTLLALIPLLAVAISVTSSLLKKEGEEKIYQAIDKMVSVVMPPATLNTNSAAVSAQSQPGHVGHLAADKFRNFGNQPDGRFGRRNQRFGGTP